MAITQADIDLLDKKILKARRRIKVDGREIENQTLSEMLKARSVMLAELTKASLTKRRRTAYRSNTHKGY